MRNTIEYYHFHADATSPNGLKAKSSGTVISFANDTQFQAEFDRLESLTPARVPGRLAYAIGIDNGAHRWHIAPIDQDPNQGEL
jgi:hypothetical protein